ncbi:MAG: methylmalonyl-CoA epimerase [Candidatus Marinimicrobia bacterium]|nr:methylmalonyl-CoA epimerase [Candidatus Neomarinimicrobiota bacterium]|tara:strand:+ start:88 stop:495 length:408 start_codon:yes stop_codon:yes gene_type:complete
MKILGIEHIGIAVNQIDERKDFWEKVLGIKLTGQENVESESVETAIFDSDSGKIELLESKNPDSAIQKFINKSGEGIHHICLKVDDIESAIGELKIAGISVIYPVPKVGAEGFLVTFIHPKDTGGVLVELAQEPR